MLGFGVRIGFLGLLHMDIIRERLEREYNLDLVVTNPSTDYKVTMTDGSEQDIKSAADLPPVTKNYPNSGSRGLMVRSWCRKNISGQLFS